jgi:hypothetical protein
MRRYGEPSKDQEPLLPLQFCSDCITATRGYHFREGQVLGTQAPDSTVMACGVAPSDVAARVAAIRAALERDEQSSLVKH